MTKNKIIFSIAIQVFLIFAALIFFNYSNFDLWFQRYFFDFDKKLWMVDRFEPIKKIIFYILPKILFGIFILFCVIKAYCSKNFAQRKFFLLIALGLIFIPLIAGNIKKFTNIYCPAQLEIYGGGKPYIKIFESYPSDFVQIKKGQCFPAGHAITGFSLFILFFALQKKSQKIFAFFGAFLYGWILGLYQIAKGAHFFSDTLLVMQICFLLANLIFLFFEAYVAKRVQSFKKISSMSS